MPASGSVYPSAKSISPFAMRGRNAAFCSSVPNVISVGPTCCTPTVAPGAPT